MKKQQWIIVLAGLILVVVIYIGGKTTAPKSDNPAAAAPQSTGVQPVTTELLLTKAKQRLNPEQITRLSSIENSVKRGDVKDQQLHVYHQLAKFWSDSAKMFEPFAYYTSEAAKLENSEKSLTFAAHLFLDLSLIHI